MEVTKTGNIKIRVNPERKYPGTFVGVKYYKRADLIIFFGRDVADLDPNGLELGCGPSNADMIMHHTHPFRRVGYIA